MTKEVKEKTNYSLTKGITVNHELAGTTLIFKCSSTGKSTVSIQGKVVSEFKSMTKNHMHDFEIEGIQYHLECGKKLDPTNKKVFLELRQESTVIEQWGIVTKKIKIIDRIKRFVIFILWLLIIGITAVQLKFPETVIKPLFYGSVILFICVSLSKLSLTIEPLSNQKNTKNDLNYLL